MIETVLENIIALVGLDIQGAQITSQELDIRQIRACMDEAGKDLALRAEWSELYRDWQIDGQTYSAPLPDDFLKMASHGAVRFIGAGHLPVRAVTAPEQWEMLRERPSQQPYYHLKEGRLHFLPEVPELGARVRYVSRNWVNGTSDQVQQNSDKVLIPENLLQKGTVWRWKRLKSLPYDDVHAEFEADLQTELGANRGAM